MSPRNPANAADLTPYFLSKWKCPIHGFYSARTSKPVDPEKAPVPCPECVISVEFQSQLQGHTSQTVPFVSKPRIPKKTDTSMIVSDRAPVRKRGVSW